MNKEDFSEFCAPGVQFKLEYIDVNQHVSLKMITFTPLQKTENPPVVFVFRLTPILFRHTVLL